MKCIPCQKACPGCPYGGPRVGGKGTPESPLVIVAESPGKQECRAKIPLAGASGRVVHTFIGEEEALFLNAMECFPHPMKKTEGKTKKAIRCCEDRLFRQLREYPRRLIVAMGGPALQAVTRDPGLKITKVRGRLLQNTGAPAELGVLPMLHPAALMRGMGSLRQWKGDIAYAKRLMDGGPISDFQEPQTINIPFEGFVSRDGFYRAIENLDRYSLFTGDIETATLGFLDEGRRVLDLGVQAVDDPENIVYRFAPEWLEQPLLRMLLEAREKRWIWQNGKFDINYLWATHGIEAHVDEDTMLLSHARDEIPGGHDLDVIASDVLHAPDHKEMIKLYLPKKDASYALIPDGPRIEYLGLDVAKTTQSFSVLRRQIAEDPAMERLYTKILIPGSALLSRVERNGIWVNQDVVKQNEKDYVRRIEENRQKICDLAGYEINPNSYQQVSKLLYQELKLPNLAKGSTSQDVLEKLPKLPIIERLLEHRRLVKIHGTYIKSVWKHLKGDGRVHPSFLLHATETGRLSSREPNAQNQPKEPAIRSQYGAPPGRTLIEVDLKQAELRVLACLSRDPDLCQIFASGRDLHDEVAREMFGLTAAEKPTSLQRRNAKAINFGLIYGLSAYKLALDLGISEGEANDYIQAWFDNFPLAYQFIQKCRNAPTKYQTITTCFGRKKRPRLVTKENLRGLQNEACNFPEQSTASDITFKAAMRVLEPLEGRHVNPDKPGTALMINLVHDAIMVEVDDDVEEIRRCAEIISWALREVPKEYGLTEVTFESDVKVGTQWGHMEEFIL